MAIEKKFVSQKIKEFKLKQFIANQLSRVGLSDIRLQRTPLGDKVLIKVSRPGLVVGRRGSNIQKLTDALKNEFHLENPQIEIEEVKEYGLDSAIMAEMIVNSLERFGSKRFKGVGHKSVMDIMRAGALGVEIIISGKIPSMRAKTWRFYQGYMKKCGNVAVSGVDTAYKVAVLKSGVVGVKVMIMPPTTLLPDKITLYEEAVVPVIEEVKGEEAVKVQEEIKDNAEKVVEKDKTSKSVKTDKQVKVKEKKSVNKSNKEEKTTKNKQEPKKVVKKIVKKTIDKSTKTQEDSKVESKVEPKVEPKVESKVESSEDKIEPKKEDKKE